MYGEVMGHQSYQKNTFNINVLRDSKNFLSFPCCSLQLPVHPRIYLKGRTHLVRLVLVVEVAQAAVVEEVLDVPYILVLRPVVTSPIVVQVLKHQQQVVVQILEEAVAAAAVAVATLTIFPKSQVPPVWMARQRV